MPRLSSFSGDDLADFGNRIRAIPRGATTMEESAGAVVDLLYDELRDGEGAPECILVRLYKTHPITRLPDDLAAFARRLAPEVAAGTRCLTLLATRGLEPAWNDRRASQGHKAIPLVSVESVERLPMVAGLIRQLGLDLAQVVSPESVDVRELAQKRYGVFHVERAAGSDVIPAQDFVERYGVQAALGFGGVLFTGDFFAIVLFSRVPIDEPTADRLRILSLATRVALLPFGARVFS